VRIIPDIEVCENNSSASEKAVFYAAYRVKFLSVEKNIESTRISVTVDLTRITDRKSEVLS